MELSWYCDIKQYFMDKKKRGSFFHSLHHHKTSLISSLLNEQLISFTFCTTVTYDQYSAWAVRRCAQINEYVCANMHIFIDTYQSCCNSMYYIYTYRYICTYMYVYILCMSRIHKHRPWVKAFDTMFVVKDELFSTRKRLACTWRDKSFWISRASAWEISREIVNAADRCCQPVLQRVRPFRIVHNSAEFCASLTNSWKHPTW